MTFDRLHHMQLAMPRAEERAARDFFVGVLGMTEVDKPPALAARGGAWFRAGDVELHLGVEDNFRPARGLTRPPRGIAGAGVNVQRPHRFLAHRQGHRQRTERTVLHPLGGELRPPGTSWGSPLRAACRQGPYPSAYWRSSNPKAKSPVYAVVLG